MFLDLWRTRGLLRALIYRDASVRFRKSLLGYAWAVLLPAATVAVFTYLTSRRVLPIGRLDLPYPAFAVWNITVWYLFASTLSACTVSLSSAGSLITKINFPREVLVMAAVSRPVIDFAIRLLLVGMVFWWYEVDVSWRMLYLPVQLLPILTLAIGLGYFLAILNLITRDISSAVGMLLTYGMFAAPILYPAPVTAPFYLVNVLNPFSPLLIATQEMIGQKVPEQSVLYACAILLSLLVFLMGWRLFRLTLPRIVERA